MLSKQPKYLSCLAFPSSLHSEWKVSSNNKTNNKKKTGINLKL